MKKVSIAMILILAVMLVAGMACANNGNTEPTPVPTPTRTPTLTPTPDPIITMHSTDIEDWRTPPGTYRLEVWWGMINKGGDGYVEITAEVWVGQDYFSKRKVISIGAGGVIVDDMLEFSGILEEEDTPFTYLVSAKPTTQEDYYKYTGQR